ncbi:hypothetical protein I8540_002571, partial [Clostridium perfringens]|nr:hypothetical protein [Clostridium perfringens]
MSKLLDKYFNNLELSTEGKEKWINDFFEENNVKNELREILIFKEDFLKLLEKKFELEVSIIMLNDDIETFWSGESYYFRNYYDMSNENTMDTNNKEIIESKFIGLKNL